MDSLNHDSQVDVMGALNSTSSYFDNLWSTDNPYLKGMVNQIYPSFYCKWICLFVSKIYDKRDDFDFDIVHRQLSIP